MNEKKENITHINRIQNKVVYIVIIIIMTIIIIPKFEVIIKM
jgi:hypothetical protein